MCIGLRPGYQIRQILLLKAVMLTLSYHITRKEFLCFQVLPSYQGLHGPLPIIVLCHSTCLQALSGLLPSLHWRAHGAYACFDILVDFSGGWLVGGDGRGLECVHRTCGLECGAYIRGVGAGARLGELGGEGVLAEGDEVLC